MEAPVAADARRGAALGLMRGLLDLDPDARAARLAQVGAQDPALRAEVERLLAFDDDAAALDRGVAAAMPPAGVDPRLGRTIGPYRLDAVLGQGGMGTVFRASRVAGGFTQQVALKLIRGGFDDAVARQRFERERAILARLQHPHLVPVLDGGVAEGGAPWYAMPLVDGEPLTAWCDARNLPLAARIALAAKLCDAVQVAHQALVVHRDLKPSNVLVDAHGAPHVLDFGIAKRLDEDGGATHTAARPMTPAYAAPEQIRGEPVSTATDVFALGVIVYELACGRHPFGAEGDSAFALQRAVVETDPPRLPATLSDAGPGAEARARRRDTSIAKLRRALRGDLEQIVAKALAKAPTERYVSAAALGDDLRLWLDGLPVRAVAPAWRYRARKWIARWRWSLAGAALVLLSLLAATAFSLDRARLARQAQQVAEANAQSAQAAQRFLQNVFIAAEPWQHDGTPTTALALADRAFESLDAELGGQPLARADLYRALARMYLTAGSLERAVVSGERAVALYRDLPVADALRADTHLRASYAYSYLGRLADAQRHIAAAGGLAGDDPSTLFHVRSAQALVHRDRGRYDLAHVELLRATAARRARGDLVELPFHRGDNARMRRHVADAAREFLLQYAQPGRDRGRGWVALLALHFLDVLPASHRDAGDLALAEALEAERAVVWPDGSRRVPFTALRARLHLQHGDLAGALALARSIEPPADPTAMQTDTYEIEFWLNLAYLRLQGGDHGGAATLFAQVQRMIPSDADAADPRPLLAHAGAACASGAEIAPTLARALDSPPQPDYLGYAWLRGSPCAELAQSAAARHPDPQAPAFGSELREVIGRLAARLGDCRNGARVAIGAPCPDSAPPLP
jgi:serine/threonine protein kinase/tetratricopeptide (TPR) repeat protein